MVHTINHPTTRPEYPSLLQEARARQVFASASIVVATVDVSDEKVTVMAHQASSNIVVDIEGAWPLSCDLKLWPSPVDFG